MKELIEEIVNHCDGIIERSERMTSGNYMHNCLANRFSANTIKTCMGILSKSVIKWQTGEPKENGRYLIQTNNDGIQIAIWSSFVKTWSLYNESEITAWCKLSDVEPYKE